MFRQITAPLLAAAMSLPLASAPAWAAAPAEDGVELAPLEDKSAWIEFVVPTLAGASTAGTPIDLSYLNPEPAGANGPLRVEGERIVDGQGNEVRLFGTNITDWHSMPPKELARPMAKRLQELGINFIRIHYSDWAPASEGGLMNDDMQTLNAEKLDEMHNLVHELVQHGIYIDMNLHVARKYPGTPDFWFRMGKGLDKVSPKFIESQKQFARDLLMAVNPYNGKTMIDDPGIAILEINNENSIMLPIDGMHRSMLSSLPDNLRRPIEQRWSAWLEDKYGDLDSIRAAWLPEDVEDGENVVVNSDFSEADGRTPEGWDLEAGSGGKARVLTGESNRGTSMVLWDVQKSGSVDWSHQFHQNQLDVEPGQPYVMSFKARSPTSNELKASVMQNGGSWSALLGPAVVKLTPKWQEFKLGGVMGDPRGEEVRMSFSALNNTGQILMTDIKLHTGSVDPLAGDQSLQAGNIQMPGLASTTQMEADFDEFMMDLELEYSGEMKRFLREELGSDQIIWDSQAEWGGSFGLLREATHGDVIDVHDYPFHPSGGQNDEGEWTWWISPNSLVGEGLGKGIRSAFFRVGGMPLFVSEFDINPPNDHAAESFTFFSLLGAYQGWAGLGEYAWLNFQPEYENDRINTSYATSGHAGQMATIPTNALLFREGLVEAARDRATLTVGEQTLRDGSKEFGGVQDLWEEAGATYATPWQIGVQVRLADDGGTPTIDNLPAEPGNRIVSDTGQLTLTRDGVEQGKHLVADTPALKIFMGHSDGEAMDLGDVTLQIEPSTRNGYAHVYAVAMDSLPIAESRKVLVTTLARVENVGMRYNADRTTVGTDYGDGPTVAEPVEATLTLPGTGWSAQKLDGTGQPLNAVATQEQDGRTVLNTADDPGVWFLLTR